MDEYVLAKKRAFTNDQYEWVDDFNGINAYSDADDARLKLQKDDPDYVYEVINKKKWDRDY